MLHASFPSPDSTPSAQRPRAGKKPAPLDFGEVLARKGMISHLDLAAHAVTSADSGTALEDHLLAEGALSEDVLLDEAADHFNLRRIMAPMAADITLMRRIGPEFCEQHQLLPLALAQGRLAVATARPWAFDTIRRDIPPEAGALVPVLMPAAWISRALASHRLTAAALAEVKTPRDASCRGFTAALLHRFGAMLMVLLLLGLAGAPAATISLLCLMGVAISLAMTALRLAILFSRNRAEPGPPETKASVDLPPRVTLLVPLFRESAIADSLIAHLAALDWPRQRLEILLLTEEDDPETAATLARTTLPPEMRCLVLPRGRVQTKPRALNFALESARGDIIGIYDAEDRPEPDQLHKVWSAFTAGPPNLACLQGRLGFYNGKASWITRCFTLEYGAWFGVILPGLARLNLVVPLGGTTLFFRRQAIETLGAWDAQNVTEDADLGLRLVRQGWRCGVLDTLTREEATARVQPWVKQRSRWLKGYAMTYLTHMQDAASLARDLGLRRFFGVQLLFGGTLLHLLLAPFLWSMWLIALPGVHPIETALGRGSALAAAIAMMVAGAVNLAVLVKGMKKSGTLSYAGWLPSLFFYNALASVAMLKGLVELLSKPFHWQKTEHGTPHVSLAAPLKASADGSRTPG